MNREHTAIANPENVCFKCLKETKVIKLHISALGYGSSFDNFSTRINLCEDCIAQTNSEWWNFEIKDDEWGGSYKYEKEILNFISSLPIEGKELFYGTYANGACAGYMSGQDWIDYELGILPHEKCKEYGYYSPQEIQAYKDRFPNCKHVKIKVYSDESKGSKCFKSAFGDENGNCGLNIYNDCYMCDCFEERDGELKIIDVKEEFYKRETERLQNMIAYAKGRLKQIKDKTLTEK